MTSATSERQQARRKQHLEQGRIASEVTIRTIMGTPTGRRWMWDTLGMGHCFDANLYDDPVAAARFEGERRFGLYLLKQVQRVCPREYITMTTENTGVDVAELNSQEHEDDNG